MRVQQFTNNKGNTVKNQFIITDGNRKTFQSYKSVIAIKEDGNIILDEHYWDYSKTTGVYRNQFLGEGIAETRIKIKSGEYKLANLN